jgi:hypothetical protein
MSLPCREPYRAPGALLRIAARSIAFTTSTSLEAINLDRLPGLRRRSPRVGAFWHALPDQPDLDALSGEFRVQGD